ncbi:MAG TPA: hypothetical protein IAB15_05510 [Candidatus Ornithoclostridium faecigallinarum]|nr:hypothetical protein [Candidatus Ornithoclostridium faecigallinarum]
MGLLKKTDASTLAREAIALAEENAATAERTYRLVTTDVAAGQSIEVGVRGGGEVYAEIFSPSGDVAGTMSLIGADGSALGSKIVAAPIAASTFKSAGGEARFRFVASAAVASLKLTLSVRGGAFFEP